MNKVIFVSKNFQEFEITQDAARIFIPTNLLA